jgi:hypothetical protein
VDWQAQWEAHASMERRKYDETPVEELLELVRRGIWGSYYTIWYSIAERSSAEDASAALYGVLKSGEDYLYRYHAAAALLKLTGIDSFQPVDLSGTHKEVGPNLVRLAGMLEEMGFLRG